MSNKSIVLKVISLWLPVILQMGLIFFFSAQPSGSSVLQRFPLPGGLGHFGGYALLGLLLYRAFGRGSMKWHPGVAWKSALFALAYALTDELHQLFVPGRQASIYDIFIDLAGVLAALIVIRFWAPLRAFILSRFG